jgi:hypothetical protein
MRDHEKSFAEMLEVAESDERWEKNHAQRYLVGFAAESRSRFQRIWEGHGLPTLRFELVKRGDGEQRVALRTKKVVACASGARGVNTDSGHELGGPEGSSEKVRHRWIGEPRETGRDTDPPSLCPSPRRAG